MSVYLISYDLKSPNHNELPLAEAIKKLSGAWFHALDSSWLVVHTGPTSAILKALMPHLDENDRLMVMQMSGEAMWYGFTEQQIGWIKSHHTLAGKRRSLGNPATAPVLSGFDEAPA